MCWFIYFFLCYFSFRNPSTSEEQNNSRDQTVDSRNYNRNQVNVTSVPDCVSMFTMRLTGKLMLTLRTELLQ